MRIAMIGPFGLHPNKTMGSRALGLARPLARRGHEMAIFMPPWQTPQEADRWWEEDGVTLRYSVLGKQPFSTTRNLLEDVFAWQPDVIHGFKPKAFSGLAMWWLWQFHRQKFHLVVDMDDWEGPGGWNDLAPVFGRAETIFCLAGTMGDAPRTRPYCSQQDIGEYCLEQRHNGRPGALSPEWIRIA